MSYIENSYIGNHTQIKKIIKQNFPVLFKIISEAKKYKDFLFQLELHIDNTLDEMPDNQSIISKQASLKQIKLLIENDGREFTDPNRNDLKFNSRPIYWFWQEATGKQSHATGDFFDDIFSLFDRAFGNSKPNILSKEVLLEKMKSLPKATNPEVIAIRKKSKQRVIKGLITIIENSKNPHKTYKFTTETTIEEKTKSVNQWWNDYRFHLRFAIQNLEQLRLTTNNQLPENVMRNFENGVKKGIPIFINPYYLALVHITDDGEFCASDRTIRDYIFNSKDLVDTFGKIKAWEKEDIIEDGKPNAAGWHLPGGDSVHRRYPEVAIFIPEGRGRACAGLCVSCQRMYGFQKGQLNFNLDKMDKNIDKGEKRRSIFEYFKNDSHLQDILITGGDAFMNTDKGLREILDDFYKVVINKKANSKLMNDGKRIAMFQRVRLGTRILAYLPQRVGDELISILKEFKEKASKEGIKQFVIQTHFETSMELTPEAIETIVKLRETGWIIVNQQVFTAASSRRANSMQMRRELNKLGILPYYTFAVKGFKENRENFTPLARVAQEVYEEKIIGKPTKDRSEEFHNNPENNHKLFAQIEKEENIPFVATDRSILNLPALGKSLSFEQVGITIDGRRVLSFEHDTNRNHSPVVQNTEKVIIVEAKSISNYLRQLETMGENINDYDCLYAYSSAQTEKRSKVFEYPEFEFDHTTDYNNCEV